MAGGRATPGGSGGSATVAPAVECKIITLTNNIIITSLSAIDKLQIKAQQIIPLVGLARSKQDPTNRAHVARYFIPPPASRGQFKQQQS